ncbi:hypothetical protein KAJ27_06405 [bacterium]|nr:hypothetical protein [Candidatus Neomarinimicrobiota bacterium]MCK5683731.1 hypothetical protein [bacterium]
MQTIQNIDELEIVGGQKLVACTIMAALTVGFAITTLGTAALFTGGAWAGYCL